MAPVLMKEENAGVLMLAQVMFTGGGGGGGVGVENECGVVVVMVSVTFRSGYVVVSVRVVKLVRLVADDVVHGAVPVPVPGRVPVPMNPVHRGPVSLKGRYA